MTLLERQKALREEVERTGWKPPSYDIKVDVLGKWLPKKRIYFNKTLKEPTIDKVVRRCVLMHSPNIIERKCVICGDSMRTHKIIKNPICFGCSKKVFSEKHGQTNLFW